MQPNKMQNVTEPAGREGRNESSTLGMIDAAKEKLSPLVDKAKEYGEKAQELGLEAKDQTEQAIRRYPTAAIVGGFVAGTVVGMLIARK